MEISQHGAVWLEKSVVSAYGGRPDNIAEMVTDDAYSQIPPIMREMCFPTFKQNFNMILQ